jgi:Cof subfamily protein (haloacid dehalogenase superfamily)
MRFDFNKVKLIASDLDGTLLRDDGTISSYTKEIVSKIKEKGIIFTLVTGRMYHFFSDYVDFLEIDDFVISGDGALIKNRKGKILQSHLIPSDISYEIIKFLLPRSQNFFIIREDDLIKAAPQAYNDLITFFGKNISEEKIQKEDCNRLLKIVSIEEEKQAERLLLELKEKFSHPELKFIIGPSYMKKNYKVIIIRSPLINKANAIKSLVEYYAIGNYREEVLVLGDWINDIPMFKEFPLSATPSNCDSAVKKYVEFIGSKSNNEDFVAHFLEEHFL